MIDVGFTGTRHGMTPAQLDAVVMLVKQLAEVDELCGHHGDCVGADAEFHDVMRKYARSIVIHTPLDPSHRAFCERDQEYEWGQACTGVIGLPGKTHFARNRDIVDQSRVMIAAPFESSRQERGGTWYTYDYARKKNKPMACVLRAPSGVMLEFSGDRTWPAAKEEKRDA